MYDLIIVGGGPAGVTAGIYAARQKLNTLLITKEFGGQMMGKAVAIKNYPCFEEISALELIQKFEKHLRKQEINTEQAEVTKLKKIGKKFSVFTKDKQRFESKAVIISSGADPRALEIPGEKEFIGRGVSYCVTCYGPLFSNKNVAVIGGGNSGFEAAIFLEKIAKIIYILEYGEKIKEDIELDTTITDELKEEGIVREIIRRIQDLRKKAGLTPSDTNIIISYSASEKTAEIFARNKDIILSATRSKELKENKAKTGEFLASQDCEINSQAVWLALEKS